MTKKAQTLKPRRHLLFWCWCLMVLLSIVLCFVGFLRIQYYSKSTGSDSHFFDVDSIVFFKPKIAFLFLIRRNLPLDFLWQRFFEYAESPDFSIYVHTEPGFVLNESTTEAPLFYDRQLKSSVKVAWGEASMIEAERLLFQEALKDPLNQRFVLLSDSCIPLYNFSYIYNYLMRSPRSFVDSFLDMRDTQYNSLMAEIISKDKWRKGSQWITLIREHAEVVVLDAVIFPVFKKYCKRRPPVDTGLGMQNLIQQKQHNCIPDEHYVPTLFAMSGLESELERRTVTYSMWNQSTSKTETQTWHPFTFSFTDSTPQLIKQIRDIERVNYKTELRTEVCKNNSTFAPCFLFARKFSSSAAARIMSHGLLENFPMIN